MQRPHERGRVQGWTRLQVLALGAGAGGGHARERQHRREDGGSGLVRRPLQVLQKKESEHKEKAEVETEGTSTPEKKAEEGEEEKPATPVAETSGEEDAEKAEDVTELRDFISKEEGAFWLLVYIDAWVRSLLRGLCGVELYYYGAPGEFEDAPAEAGPPMPKESFVEVTKKNVKNRPLSFDEERPAPP
ncbi:hypothetical protein ON010_g688 [Phytophthora cinnamomi]|nr:hypothetical protein ON010_g688 [Phytophthora cinnamomi]